MTVELRQLARDVAKLLSEKQRMLVLAESCTGGLVAATLAQVPGISNYLCGSAVTYQNATKHHWLGISNKMLDKPGPVSQETACLMAENVLGKTPAANIAASVTGHLGPNAPSRFDGVVFVAVAQRNGAGDPSVLRVRRYRLTSRSRQSRQREAAATVLRAIGKLLDEIPTPHRSD